MIKRIVKMSFHPDKTDDFIAIFEKSKEQIRAFEGVRSLELLRDKNNPNIFFTLSYWESEDQLEKYRNSRLFNDTWTKTKQLFNDKPQAWSTESIFRL